MGNRLCARCVECFIPKDKLTTDPTIQLIENPSKAESLSKQKTKFEFLNSTAAIREDMSEELPMKPPPEAYNIQEISNQLEAAKQALVEIANHSEDDGSSLQEIIRNEDYTIYGKETNRGVLLKCKWTVEASPQVILAFTREHELRKLWDEDLLTCGKLTELEEIEVYFRQYRQVAMVSSRDFLLASTITQTNDGWVEVSTSINSLAYPPQEGVVRAKLFIGGMYLQPDTTEETTRVTLVTEMDFGGMLPRSMMKVLSARRLPHLCKAMTRSLMEYKTSHQGREQ